MKSMFKRISACLLALMIVISLLPASTSAAKISTPATGYTKASDVNYVKSGNYVLNWGARNETCVFLSTYAQNFYSGSYTFDNMSKLSGGSSQGNAPQSALYSSLKSLMTSKHSHQTSYNETRNQYRYTDCVANNSSNISSFYSGKTLSGTWDSGSTWNREHTWPNSKGLGGNDENDIMMLRPTSVSENSSRGNTAYGEGSGYFDPGESTRGDVARIVLYVYVRWGNTNYMWGKSGVMESMSVLLKWMKEDPVDTWEMGRNDAVQSITGTRNVFVDYPEYAWLLFGQDVPAGITTPSDNDGTTANPGGNTGSGNTGSGNSGSSSGSTGTTSMITSPETGKAYKLSMNNGKNLYFMGVINKDSTPWYMKSSENVADAIDVYLEAASGGYRLYFTINGTKTYLVMYKDGTHYSLKLTTEASTVYTWNSQYNTLVAMNEDKECFIGTSGTYNTFSCNTMDKVGSSYVAHLFGVGGSSSSGNSGSSSGNTNTNPPATNPPATNPPATNPPATNPPATNPPATNPPATNPPATNPPASQPDINGGAQSSTPAPQPSGPVPMETKPLDPNDFYTPTQENDDSTLIIILAIVAAGAIIAGVVVYFVVFKPKKAIAPVAEEAPAEETPTEDNE